MKSNIMRETYTRYGWINKKPVPHSRMIKVLKIAKVPNAIEQLSHQWETIIYINGHHDIVTEIITEIIKYFGGIFQGNNTSVLLFILSVNPLSIFLNKLKEYSLGTGNNRISVTHDFFIDDLKLYGTTLDIIRNQSDLVTTFTAEIEMKFGEDKCRVMRVEKGKVINSDTPFKINNLKIKPIIEGETNKYLGQDEKMVHLIKKEFHLNTSREYIKYRYWNSQHLINKLLITVLPYLY